MTTSDIVNISRPLTEMARLQPDTPAIIFPQKNRTLTFRELDQESDRIARGFLRLGIGRGMKTALQVPPSPELFALTFALFKAGAGSFHRDSQGTSGATSSRLRTTKSSVAYATVGNVLLWMIGGCCT